MGFSENTNLRKEKSVWKTGKAKNAEGGKNEKDGLLKKVKSLEHEKLSVEGGCEKIGFQ